MMLITHLLPISFSVYPLCPLCLFCNLKVVDKERGFASKSYFYTLLVCCIAGSYSVSVCHLSVLFYLPSFVYETYACSYP
jgi:hypothetical protein